MKSIYREIRIRIFCLHRGYSAWVRVHRGRKNRWGDHRGLPRNLRSNEAGLYFCWKWVRGCGYWVLLRYGQLPLWVCRYLLPFLAGEDGVDRFAKELTAIKFAWLSHMNWPRPSELSGGFFVKTCIAVDDFSQMFQRRCKISREFNWAPYLNLTVKGLRSTCRLSAGAQISHGMGLIGICIGLRKHLTVKLIPTAWIAIGCSWRAEETDSSFLCRMIGSWIQLIICWKRSGC